MAASLPKLSGPKTPKGKATSSRNATKHGLTAVHPITVEEDKRLQYLIKQLKKEYRPQTITEELLITRVANIQVRIERVQKLERAWYDEARRDAEDLDKILETLDEPLEHKQAFALSIARGQKEDWETKLANLPIEHHRDLLLELSKAIHTDYVPEDYDSFAVDFPLLNQRMYLYCQAFDFEPKILLMDLEEFPKETCKWLADFPAFDELVANYDADEFSSEVSESCASHAINFRTLIDSTHKRLRKKLAVQSITMQVAADMETKPSVAAPKKEQLEQLIRYSTSLNNQFSKALGELRHVVAGRERLN
ncbi:MAG: hypothetical protein ABJK25_14080 [Halieaceae bacterium]